MTQKESRAIAQRLVLAMEMHEAGVAMMRQTLRRRFPIADHQTIEKELTRWLKTRPGAEHGDSTGRVVGIERLFSEG